MTGAAIAGIAVALLLLLIICEVPIAYALAGSGAVGMLMLSGSNIAGTTIASVSYGSLAKYTLVIIPLFIAMGVLARHARIAEDAFAVTSRALRRVPGNLAIAAILACAVFGAVSGSSVAAVVAIGRPAIQEMVRHGYSRTVALGVVGAAGTFGVLIPPSIVLVIYGMLTGVSIGTLLLAGILPGILSAVLYVVSVVIRAKVQPELFGQKLEHALVAAAPAASASTGGGAPSVEPREARAGASEVTATPESGEPARTNSAGLLRALVLFVVVLGGIYTGVFTAIESAAVGAVTVFAMLLWEHRGVGVRGLWHRLREAVGESVELNAMVAALLVGSGIFSAFMIASGTPLALNRWVSQLSLDPLIIVALILLAFIPLGMFLDPISSMLIAVPLVYPIVDDLGFSGVWFGVMVVKFIEIGLITPPLGINAFVVAGVDAKATVEQAFRGVLWFLPIDLVTIAILFAFPWFSTALGGAG